MHACLITMAVIGLPAGLCAQQRTQAVSPVPIAYISHGTALPLRERPLVTPRISDENYRIAPSFNTGRSAHGRAIDEMNAINTRRPRAFRFRPVMALTLDAADMDGPARMTGIAPSLMGAKRTR